jgi:uncharacterized protein (TIGR02145 family)
METIKINGLLWDTENLGLGLGGGDYFTHKEAMLAAEDAGKRLPTEEEFEALTALGSTWDAERLGRWFGKDSELKQESKMSIFLPASGSRNSDDGALLNVGLDGYYWSSSVASVASLAYYMFFDSVGMYSAYGVVYRAYGRSVRCVKMKTANS